MKQPLSSWLRPLKYELDVQNGHLKITGTKLPPPSKRISLHQKGLKISSAQITRHDRKGDQTFMVERINHLPTSEQVRLHTKETLFPGSYVITLSFTSKAAPNTESPKRELLPCIDEPEAWVHASFKII